MFSYNLDHIYEIDESFVDYVQSTTKMINTYGSILDALKELNKREEKKPLVFVKTRCSNKAYACFYCGDEQYDSSIEDLERIVQLHVFKQENIAKWKKDARVPFF